VAPSKKKPKSSKDPITPTSSGDKTSAQNINSQVIHTFSTPVFSYNAALPPDLHAQLIEDIYAWKAADEVGVQKSNNRGWHSTTDIFLKRERSFRTICLAILNCANASTKNVAPTVDLDAHSTQAEGWVNINPQWGYNAPHDHPGFTWSLVYYVKVPQDDHHNVTGKSGRIEFLDPRTNIAAQSQELAKSSGYFAPKQLFHPKENMILCFPSYLRHWVYPNEEPEDRISMAFNIKYTPNKVETDPR
jgi:uncharacterized protein (TIGR02466 family)